MCGACFSSWANGASPRSLFGVRFISLGYGGPLRLSRCLGLAALFLRAPLSLWSLRASEDNVSRLPSIRFVLRLVRSLLLKVRRWSTPASTSLAPISPGACYTRVPTGICTWLRCARGLSFVNSLSPNPRIGLMNRARLIEPLHRRLSRCSCGLLSLPFVRPDVHLPFQCAFAR